MLSDIVESLKHLPEDACEAAKHMITLLSKELLPLMQKISEKIDAQSFKTNSNAKCRSTFLLCCNQISKSVISLVSVFKNEYQTQALCDATRRFLLDRLQFCVEKLTNLLDTSDDSAGLEFGESHLFRNSFVQWLDDVFDLLGDLSDTFARDADFQQLDDSSKDAWRSDCKNEIEVLCGAVNEMLLSALTLNQCCQYDDQTIIKVRCQVILRESTKLLSELLEQKDMKLDNVKNGHLKEKLHFTSVKINIDVLKESLYALERSVNNAILTLILDCFHRPSETLTLLKEHASTCDCGDDKTCKFVENCDLLHERVMEIGLFAATCSTDDKKILPLKSSLASLEALEPHMIPSISSFPSSYHSEFLSEIWKKEISQVKDVVYLIVDPIPMVELSCDLMQSKILSLQKSTAVDVAKTTEAMAIGQICVDIFTVYLEKEPKSLGDLTIVKDLIADLNKAVHESYVYWDLASKDKFDPKLIKRLKLVYTLLRRMFKVLRNVDNDIFFEEDNDARSMITTERKHSHAKLSNRKGMLTNLGKFHSGTFGQPNDRNTFIKSISHRLDSVRSRRLKICPKPIEIDSFLEGNYVDRNEDNKHLPTPFKQSNKMLLYNFGKSTSRKHVSLRERLLRNKFSAADSSKGAANLTRNLGSSKSYCDTTMNLQITEILEQLTDLSDTLPSMHKSKSTSHPISTIDTDSQSNCTQETTQMNILKLSINEQPLKDSWTIEIKSDDDNSNTEKHKSSLSISDAGIDVSFRSEVDTPQRVSDLKFLEEKLASLKQACENIKH